MKKIDQLKDHMAYLIMFREVFNLGTKATEALEFAYGLVLDEFYKEAQKEEEQAMQIKAEKLLAGHPYKKFH
jgi:hypothetical protein